MKLREKHDWGRIWYEGKKDNFKITVARSGSDKSRWYFYLIREKDDKRYNSLWDEISYPTIETCVEAVEDWINNNK